MPYKHTATKMPDEDDLPSPICKSHSTVFSLNKPVTKHGANHLTMHLPIELVKSLNLKPGTLVGYKMWAVAESVDRSVLRDKNPHVNFVLDYHHLFMANDDYGLEYIQKAYSGRYGTETMNKLIEIA